MKKLIYILIAFVLGIANYGYCADVGTCAIDTTNPDGTSIYKNQVKFLCTAHTDGNLSVTLTANQMSYLDGRYLLKIKSWPGATTPTDNSELSIVDSLNVVWVDPADNGLNFIDADGTTPHETLSKGPTGYEYRQMHQTEPITIAVTNQIVASATMYIIFDVTGREAH